MPLTNVLIKTLTTAKKENRKLTNVETVNVLKALANISSNHQIIEKALTLFVFIEQKNSVDKLSERESQIFNLIGCDFSSNDIALLLNISKYTVSTHRKNIIKKLKLSGTRKLRLIANQHLHNQMKEISNT